MTNDERLNHLMETGHKHYTARRYADALTAYQEMSSLAPKRPDGYYFQAMVRQAQGAHEEVLRLTDSALRLPDTSARWAAQLYHLRSAAFRALGRVQEAEEAAADARQLDPAALPSRR